MAKPTTSTPHDSTSRGSRTGAPAKSVARSSGRPASPPAERRPNAPSLVTFFQESRSELRKVTWPTRQEAVNLTVAVIAMTVFVAAFLGIMDEVLTRLVQPLIG